MERDKLWPLLQKEIVSAHKYRKMQEDLRRSLSSEQKKDHKRNKLLKLLALFVLVPNSLLLINAAYQVMDGVLPLLLLLVPFLLYVFFDKLLVARMRKKAEAAYDELNRLPFQFSEESMMPDNFRDIAKVEQFYYYMANQLAENLQECIELYNEEKDTGRLIEEVNEVSDTNWETNGCVKKEAEELNPKIQSVG